MPFRHTADRFGTFGPPPRIFRTPVFFQRVLELTALAGMLLLLPLLSPNLPGRSLVILAAMALIITAFVAPKVQARKWLLFTMVICGCLLLALAIPKVPTYVGPLHLMMHAVLALSAPFLNWPLTIGSALALEAIYMGAKSNWTFLPLLAPAFLPNTAVDLAGKIVLAVLSKNWYELNLAARKSAMELTVLTGSSHDLIAAVDRNGIIRSVNGACRLLLGAEPQEITGRPYTECFGQPGAPFVSEIAGLLHSGETAMGIMSEARCKDGSYTWIEWNVEPIPELDAVLFIGRDVSHRKT